MGAWWFPVDRCLYRYVRERDGVRREPGSAGSVIDLREVGALAQAGSAWMKCVLMFDATERCWALETPGSTYDYLRIEDLNKRLTRPRCDVVEATRWATRVLEAGDCRDWWAEGELRVAPRVTEWRVVRGSGWRGFAPLFNVTPPCETSFRDLDPATGADCRCLPRPPAARRVVEGVADGAAR